jgi:basic membrane protein A
MSSSSRGMMAAVVIIIITIGAVGAWILIANPFAPTTPTETTTTTTTTTTGTTTTTTTTATPNPYDVAIVFATGGLGDKSFNDGCFEGATQAATDFGMTFTYVEPTAIVEYEGYIRTYAEHADYADPYDLIITIGFDQANALMAVADDYPDQHFAIVDMFIDPGNYTNVASLLFEEHQGSALVGAIAGLMTETDKIGFVGGMDIPLINKFLAGYTFGANYTNMGINVTYAYTNDWVDTSVGQTLADGMYAGGADIIFAAAGRSGLGIFDSCADTIGTNSTPIWTIGVDSPQMYLGTADPENPVAPTWCMTSMLKRVDVAIYNMMRDTYYGNFTGGVKSFNLANGGVGYEINEDLLTLPPAVISAVEALKADIISGTVTVPDSIYWT